MRSVHTVRGGVLRRVSLVWVALAVTAVALVTDLLVAPPDRFQGEAQRLMYVHVPSAWTAYLAFGVVALASVLVLLGAPAWWDAVARAAAEVGVAMTGLAIAEGSMWGHVAWGTWWTWDPRLVTTAVLLVIYVCYLAVRMLPGPTERVRRRAAVLGAVAVLWLPVVHLSVLWWRTLHQPPTLLRPSLSDPIAASMLVPLLLSVLAWTLLAFVFCRARVQQLRAAGEAPELVRPERPDDVRRRTPEAQR